MSLLKKVFISTLIVSLFTFFLLAYTLESSFRNGLQSYFNESELNDVRMLAKKLSEKYSPENGWDNFYHDRSDWYTFLEALGQERSHTALDPAAQARVGKGHPPFHDVPPHLHDNPIHPPIGLHAHPPVNPRADEDYFSLSRRPKFLDELINIDNENLITTAFTPLGFRLNILDINGRIIEGRPENIRMAEVRPDLKLSKIDIKFKGKTVGYITAVQSVLIAAPLAEEFSNHQSDKMYFVVSLMFLVNFLCCSYLINVYLRPLKQVEAAGKELMNHNYDYKINLHSKDEIGSLASTYNSLTHFLKKEKEKRDQWITDIAHELRTPMQVLSSQVEAIQDSLIEPNAKNMSSISDQIQILSSLVEDLYILSLSDEKANVSNISSVDLNLLLESSVSAKEQQFQKKDIEVLFNYEKNDLCLACVDASAIQRVFANIIENSVRYTDAGGVFKVTITRGDSDVIICFDDTAPCVPKDSLEKIFDRLYRVDKSRGRENGGAGLGLSICHNIIKLHNGTMKAGESALGGLNLIITIPIKHQEK